MRFERHHCGASARRSSAVSEDRSAVSLLQRVRAGDTDALGELYRLHADAVYRIARQLTGSDADAQDVTQDVFVGLPEALSRLDSPRHFEAWLRAVTVHLARTRQRSGRRRRELSLSALKDRLLPVVREPAPVDRLALQRAIDRLPSSLRVVFVLREVEGLAHAEIAELLGISRRASEVRLHRAREWLRRRLGRDR